MRISLQCAGPTLDPAVGRHAQEGYAPDCTRESCKCKQPGDGCVVEVRRFDTAPRRDNMALWGQWFPADRGGAVSNASQGVKQSRAKTPLLDAVPWIVLLLLVAALGGLLWVGPSRLWALLGTGRGAASEPLDLTIVHTNDTWGFVFGCG